MARYHDVVSVTVNHRLNILASSMFLRSRFRVRRLRQRGDDRLVQSLKWVQENIANFGGDPDRVMIYGSQAAVRR